MDSKEELLALIAAKKKVTDNDPQLKTQVLNEFVNNPNSCLAGKSPAKFVKRKVAKGLSSEDAWGQCLSALKSSLTN